MSWISASVLAPSRDIVRERAFQRPHGQQVLAVVVAALAHPSTNLVQPSVVVLVPIVDPGCVDHDLFSFWRCATGDLKPQNSSNLVAMTRLLEDNLAGLCLRNQRAVVGIYRHNRRVLLLPGQVLAGLI
jgi:hypothetical protein